MPNSRRANIRDVAKESGVSLTTVSLVINGNDQRISEPTRQRVRAAIEKLNYTPSRLARGLPNRRANTLAILVPALQNAFAQSYFGEIISGAYEQAADKGYRILLEVARRDYVRKKEYLTLLEENAVDGILFVGSNSDHTWLSDFDGNDRPLMLVNNRMDEYDLHSVVCDYAGAGKLAARHLTGLGHTRIGHISGPRDSIQTAAELTNAFIDGLEESGITTGSAMIVDGQYEPETGKIACDELLRRDPKLTAIFAANDRMALGAYQSIREHGKRPGEDIAVLGCDDIPAAALADPALSSIRMNFFKAGAVSAKKLIGLVESKGKAPKPSADGEPAEPKPPTPRVQETVEVGLCERDSCKAI